MMSQCSRDQDDIYDRVIICTENISCDHKITSFEILSHAEKLGVDCITEFELLPLVLNGLIHPLPVNWIPCYDRRLQEFFYYNLENGTSQWEHPIDEHYKNLVSIIRNEYGGNLNEFVRNKKNLEMLPLRQNRKPQLLPIKQLLRCKDEEKSVPADDKIVKYDLHPSLKTRIESSPTYKKSVSFITNESIPEKDSQKQFLETKDEEKSVTADDKIVKYDLHSSLKTRIDSSPIYKKSVSFITNESVPEKEYQSLNTEHKKGTNEIASSTDNWIPASMDPLLENSDFTRKQEISPLSRELNKKIFSLKKSVDEIKSFPENHVPNNFKRLHINLRQPESLIFSDSNHDDSRNIFSGSPTSELISEEQEEEESPYIMLTNESGIDVNTVTDLQKLKARSKLSNQNIDVDKQLSGVINVSLRKAISEVERNLNIKIETLITEEITKLRKLARLESNFNNSSINIEKRSNYETLVDKTRESFKIFEEEIENKVEENRIVLEKLQNTYNLEMNELRENMKQTLKFFETEHECGNNLEKCQEILQNLIEERLSDIEKSLMKKMETFETENKSEWEAFKMEKRENFMELNEKFRTFAEEKRNDSENRLLENSKIIVQRGLNELFMKMSSNDPVFLNFEKFILNLLSKLQTETKIENTDKRTIATQTENTINSKEIIMWKNNINAILSTAKCFVEETSFPKRFKNEEIFKENQDELFVSKNTEKINYLIPAQVPLNIESCKKDFISFEEFSLHIDEELDFYRNKYLTSSKWWNIKRNKNQ